MQKSSNITKIFYFGAIATLLVGFGIFVLEKAQVTNFYTKPVQQPVSDTRPVNDVQYTPADPTDNDSINQQKQDGTLGNTEQPATNGTPTIILNASGQDSPGGPVVIRALLGNITTGTCSVTMQKDSTKKTYTAAVTNAGTYYTCEGFDIPFNDLQIGSWQTVVSVTGSGNTGSAELTIEVK